MHVRVKSAVCLAVLLCGLGAAAAAQGAVVSLPFFGDVGVKNEGGRYTVALGSWGSWAAKGHFNSSKDYRLTSAIPVDNFIGFIPVAGQVLGALGLSTVEVTIQPTGAIYTMICESGGLGLLRGTVSDSLSQVPSLRMAIDKIISGLEIRSLVITGQLISKNLAGKIDGELAVIGKTMKFSGDGELSLNALVSMMVDKVVPAVSDFATEAAKAVYGEAKSAAMAAGRETAALANYAYDQARQGAANVTASVKHSGHDFNKCFNECVPNYGKGQANPMRDGSNKAVLDFLDRLRPTILSIEGSSSEETAFLRFSQFDNEWYQFIAALDQKWGDVYNDREVDNYFFKDESEKQGRARYREVVQIVWDNQKSDRGSALFQFLLAPNPNLARPKKAPASALSELAFFARNGIPVHMLMKKANLAWNLTGANGYPNGSNVNLGRFTGDANQQWIFVPAGKPNVYHIKNASSGRFIHISGANDARGSSLVTWDGAGATAPQTIFRAEADADGSLRFYSNNGFAFDLEGGIYKFSQDLRLWDRNGQDPQAFYLSRVGFAKIQPYNSLFKFRDVMLEYYAKTQTPVYIRNKQGGLVATVVPQGGQYPAGAGIAFSQQNGGANQKWILVATEGKPGQYHFKSLASGRFIHIGGAQDKAGSTLNIWDGAGKDAPQTYFRYTVDAAGYYHFLTAKGFAFDLDGGQGKPDSKLILWDNHGGDGQSLSVTAAR